MTARRGTPSLLSTTTRASLGPRLQTHTCSEDAALPLWSLRADSSDSKFTHCRSSSSSSSFSSCIYVIDVVCARALLQALLCSVEYRRTLALLSRMPSLPPPPPPCKLFFSPNALAYHVQNFPDCRSRDQLCIMGLVPQIGAFRFADGFFNFFSRERRD